MIFNVLVPVVELVRADSEDEAISKLARQLASRDFAPLTEKASAFDSEPLDPEDEEEWVR